MKTFAIDNYKGPLHESDAPEPTLGEQDLLVEVAAASVNQLDVKIIEGEFKQILPYKPPFTLGHDLAGTVRAIGSGVTRFAVGDAVYARPRDGRIGTFAERIAVASDDVALAPRSVDLVEAASLPLVALAAWQALVEIGDVQPGQKVLIHAGSGGVGSIAIQLAKHLGATVATTASGSNSDYVRGLGADVVIDYRTEDFASRLAGYDLVLDGLGGENLAKSLSVLRQGGRAIGISGPPPPEWAKQVGLSAPLRLAIAGISAKIRRRAKKLGVTYDFLFMSASGDQLERIAELVDAGTLRPQVSRVFPFEQTHEALAALAAGGLTGKVVISRA